MCVPWFTNGFKDFKLWHPIVKRCINSRDITSREEEMFMQKKTSSSSCKSPNKETFEVELPNPIDTTEEEVANEENHFLRKNQKMLERI